MLFYKVKKDLILGSAESLLNVQKKFKQKFQVDDIFGNSKVFEIVIANRLNHILIPGHSGSRDCKDAQGNIFEYKHYKESSSNHSWTFNDYSQAIFEKMRRENYKIIYAHMNDTNGLSRTVFKRERPKEIRFPELDWYYEIPGSLMANYLEEKTKKITNTRKMINVSRKQLGAYFDPQYNYKRTPKNKFNDGPYSDDLNLIFNEIHNLEKATGVINLLTSNKIWELIASVYLNHNVNPEQGGLLGAHDAYDKDGNQYEYKISKSKNWTFQDISEAVLEKYKSIKGFILVTKNVETMSIDTIYNCSNSLLYKIKEKMEMKANRYKVEGRILRRKQISLTKNDISPYIKEEISV